MDDADRALVLTDLEIDLRLAKVRRDIAASVVAEVLPLGSCVDCGEPIEPERRAASPRARRCVHCQAGVERTAATHRQRVRV